MKEKKGIYEVETTGDLQLNVQIAKCVATDQNGRHTKPDEIGFFVHGYSPKSDKDIEELVTISKDEVRQLIIALEELTR